MKVLLVTPPLTQLSTSYPATPYLTGFLRSRGVPVAQADVGIEWVHALLSTTGLARIDAELARLPAAQRALPAIAHWLEHRESIRDVMPAVLDLLRGRDHSLAHRIATRTLLPEGKRFASIGPAGHETEYLDWAFGSMGLVDRARYLATLFIEDVADAVCAGIDPHFGLSRYGESLAASIPTLDPLLDELRHTNRATVQHLDALTTRLLELHRPDVVGMSIPFPGNVLGALRMATTIRRDAPKTRIVWGGGYVNTELRETTEARLFDLVDALTYDDGERPLACLLEHYAGTRPASALLRTRHRVGGEVVWTSGAPEADVPMRELPPPTYDGLALDQYLGLIDVLNPMHRLWNDTRWNKLTVAHGCYWRKCSFCDLSLAYIGTYEPAAAVQLVDRIEALMAETGSRGFHFVDEAAPPAALEALANELLRRRIVIEWWGNIRFEKTFTPALCQTLARSGCIAVSGGLEVASDRLLTLMQKGVSVEQVARVTKAFSDAGIRVHAYLMYGFPTQTAQETVDSLEYVRQLFAAGCLDSAYWHRFSATVHSPIGMNPQAYGIRILPRAVASFANNDLPFEDPTGTDHERLGEGLKKGLYNFMHGLGLDDDVRNWFAMKVPRTRVPATFIRRALAPPSPTTPRRSSAQRARRG